MKATIVTTNIRETAGDGSRYLCSRTYHRSYGENMEFLFHSEENLRNVKSKLTEMGYTEFEQEKQIKTFNQSNIR